MDEREMKHLEFLQSNIARMNQCSFQMKGWTITIVSALLAVYVATINDLGEGNKFLLVVALFPTIVCWILDAYYLSQERKFRGIYNDVIGVNKKNPQVIEDFAMPLKLYRGGRYKMFCALFSKTEYPLYLTIMICLGIGIYILK